MALARLTRRPEGAHVSTAKIKKMGILAICMRKAGKTHHAKLKGKMPTLHALGPPDLRKGLVLLRTLRGALAPDHELHPRLRALLDRLHNMTLRDACLVLQMVHLWQCLDEGKIGLTVRIEPKEDRELVLDAIVAVDGGR